MHEQEFASIDKELREPTPNELGNGKYGNGFGTWDRAAEIFKVEGFNMPDESYLY